jgi:transposase
MFIAPSLAEIERLGLLISGLQRNSFGRRSEKLDDPQQSVAEPQAGLDAAAGPSAPEPKTAPASPRSEPAKRNRGALPAHLPRIEVIVDVDDKACPGCSGTTHVIGEDVAEMLDYTPAQFRVKVIRRPRRGCRTCEGPVVQAPAPDRPIDGGNPTEALLAHILVSKYADSLPLYRQARQTTRSYMRPLLLPWLKTSPHDVCRHLYWRSTGATSYWASVAAARRGTCPQLVLRARVLCW